MWVPLGLEGAARPGGGVCDLTFARVCLSPLCLVGVAAAAAALPPPPRVQEMLRGDAATRAMDEPDERPGQTKGKYTKESASVAGFTAPRDWEKFVTGVMGPKTLLTGLCLLPIMPDWPADNRRSVMCVPLTRRTATRATHTPPTPPPAPPPAPRS